MGKAKIEFIRIWYRNWFFYMIRAFLPRKIRVKVLFYGVWRFTNFEIGEIYKVDIKGIRVLHFIDAICFTTNLKIK